MKPPVGGEKKSTRREREVSFVVSFDLSRTTLELECRLTRIPIPITPTRMLRFEPTPSRLLLLLLLRSRFRLGKGRSRRTDVDGDFSSGRLLTHGSVGWRRICC